MLQEDLDDTIGPGHEHSAVEGGHPKNVWIINRDAGREQGIE